MSDRDEQLLKETIDKYGKLAEEKMELAGRIVSLISENRKLKDEAERLGRVTWSQVTNENNLVCENNRLKARNSELFEINRSLIRLTMFLNEELES